MNIDYNFNWYSLWELLNMLSENGFAIFEKNHLERKLKILNTYFIVFLRLVNYPEACER